MGRGLWPPTGQQRFLCGDRKLTMEELRRREREYKTPSSSATGSTKLSLYGDWKPSLVRSRAAATSQVESKRGKRARGMVHAAGQTAGAHIARTRIWDGSAARAFVFDADVVGLCACAEPPAGPQQTTQDMNCPAPAALPSRPPPKSPPAEPPQHPQPPQEGPCPPAHPQIVCFVAICRHAQ